VATMFYFPNIHLATPGRLSRLPGAFWAASAHRMGGAGQKTGGFEGFAESFYQLVKPFCEGAERRCEDAEDRREVAEGGCEVAASRCELADTGNELTETGCQDASEANQALYLTAGRVFAPGSTATLTGGTADGPVE
jgi:hypothetical protein